MPILRIWTGHTKIQHFWHNFMRIRKKVGGNSFKKKTYVTVRRPFFSKKIKSYFVITIFEPKNDHDSWFLTVIHCQLIRYFYLASVGLTTYTVMSAWQIEEEKTECQSFQKQQQQNLKSPELVFIFVCVCFSVKFRDFCQQNQSFFFFLVLKVLFSFLFDSLHSIAQWMWREDARDYTTHTHTHKKKKLCRIKSRE